MRQHQIEGMSFDFIRLCNLDADRMTAVLFVYIFIFYNNSLFLIWIETFFLKGLVIPALGKCKMITACTRNKNNKVQRGKPKCSTPEEKTNKHLFVLQNYLLIQNAKSHCGTFFA